MNRIRELREEKHITQVRLSIELEVSQENISAYETGKYYPSVKSLLKLREIFGVNIDYILGLSDVKYDSIQMGALKNDEQMLLRAYRKLDPNGQKQIKAYMDGYMAAVNDSKIKL